jgi:hypothetical protein
MNLLRLLFHLSEKVPLSLLRHNQHSIWVISWIIQLLLKSWFSAFGKGEIAASKAVISYVISNDQPAPPDKPPFLYEKFNNSQI